MKTSYTTGRDVTRGVLPSRREVQQCAAAGSGCNWFEQRGLWAHHGRSGRVQLVGLGVLLLGWALMVLALLPGANFWFDILGRLGTLRASGPKSAATPAAA